MARKVTFAQKLVLDSYAYLDERFRIRNVADKIGNFYMQINMQFPKSHVEGYKLRSIWYWYPMYTMGTISFLAYVIAAISGIYLTIYYVPSTATVTGEDLTRFGDFGGAPPSEAWASVGRIMIDLPFGFMIRAIHFWSAMIMVAAVFLHMMRVWLTQAYKKPRELNWLIGFALFLITIGLGYTGYLLPWSQLSYWAGTIGNEMAAASPPPIVGRILSSFVFGEVFGTQQTLSRMYILHVVILPIACISLILLHIFLVWVQGIAEPH